MIDTRTASIDIPYPSASDLHLRISVGACRLKIAPGSGDAWVKGSYHDPTGNLPSQVIQEDGTLRITQHPAIANFSTLLGGVPSFDLELGRARAYDLTLEGGASENTLDLGGLPIQRLVVKHGAGKLDVDFSAPNPEDMSLLELSAGAVALELRNLAHANFAEMRLAGGAASYRLDFGGELRRSGRARVATGMSSVEIAVPANTAAKVSVDSVIGTLDVGDDWTKKEGAFCTPAAVGAPAAVLAITASVALGALRLRVT